MIYCFHEMRNPGDYWRVPVDGRTDDYAPATAKERKAMSACRNYAKRHGWIVRMQYDWPAHQYLMQRLT